MFSSLPSKAGSLRRSLSWATTGFGLMSLMLGTAAAQQTTSGWSFSVGVQVRRVSASFDVGAPALIDISRWYSLSGSSGPGDVGLFSTTSGPVVYDDGTVGPDASGDNAGHASFTVDSPSQVNFGTEPPGFDFPIPGTVVFHSSAQSYERTASFSERSFSDSDSAMAAAPVIEARHGLGRMYGWDVGVTTGWSMLSAQLSSGRGLTAIVQIAESTTNSRYTYTYDLPAVSGTKGFPPNYSNASETGAVFDADAYNSDIGAGPSDKAFAYDPRVSRSSGSQNRVIAVLEAQSTADLDVKANIVPLLFDAHGSLGKRLTLLVAAGPTLNILSHDLTVRTDWSRNGTHLHTDTISDSGIHFLPGVSARVGFGISLSERWSAEFTGGYDWVQAQSVSVGNTSAQIDLSSWTGMIALRTRF